MLGAVDNGRCRRFLDDRSSGHPTSGYGELRSWRQLRRGVSGLLFLHGQAANGAKGIHIVRLGKRRQQRRRRRRRRGHRRLAFVGIVVLALPRSQCQLVLNRPGMMTAFCIQMLQIPVTLHSLRRKKQCRFWNAFDSYNFFTRNQRKISLI